MHFNEEFLIKYKNLESKHFVTGHINTFFFFVEYSYSQIVSDQYQFI